MTRQHYNSYVVLLVVQILIVNIAVLLYQVPGTRYVLAFGLQASASRRLEVEDVSFVWSRATDIIPL